MQSRWEMALDNVMYVTEDSDNCEKYTKKEQIFAS